MNRSPAGGELFTTFRISEINEVTLYCSGQRKWESAGFELLLCFKSMKLPNQLRTWRWESQVALLSSARLFPLPVKRHDVQHDAHLLFASSVSSTPVSPEAR